MENGNTNTRADSSGLIVEMFAAVVLILFTILVAVLGQFFQQKWKFRALSKIKGPTMYPLIGSAHEFGLNPVEKLKDLTRITNTYGHVSKFSIGPFISYVIVSDPDVMEFFMSSPRYLKKSPDYDLLRPWIGNGLLTSTGTFWQKRRKAITPTFHFKILDSFIPIFNSAGNVLVKQLSKEIGHDFDVYPYITSYTLDNICETAMGTTVNAQENKDNEYVKAIKYVSNVFIERAFSAWKQFDCLFKYASEYNEHEKCLNIIHSFTKDVIRKRREELQNNANDITSNKQDEDVGMKKKKVFIDLLMTSNIDGKPLSDEDISEEVDTFMFEGHDTTASAIAFGLYELSKAPHIQEKIMDEMKEVFFDDLQREANIQDLNNMRYLEAFIKETLRLYPSVPVFARNLQEDATFTSGERPGDGRMKRAQCHPFNLHDPDLKCTLFLDGVTYPKDLNIAFFVYHMHRRDDLFKNASTFDPERFLGENYTEKHNFSFVPFSAGPRNCIGQKFAMYEMKSAFSKVVRNFELLPADPTKKIVLSFETILKSVTGIPIKLKKRQ